MSATTIPERALSALLEKLAASNGRIREQYPGESARRQPVHTMYGGAHLFRADTVRKLGAKAVDVLCTYAPDPPTLAAAVGIDRDLAARVYPRVLEKLRREPIEDFRIDFEDGFGPRGDEEEDRAAVATSQEVAEAAKHDGLPYGIGIRIKSLGEDFKRRSLRTFDLFLTALADTTGGALPQNFVITLPKITSREQVAALTSACDTFEQRRGIPPGTLRIELMVETPQAIFAGDGTIALPRLIAEARGRVSAAHFGPYDYTAACQITAAHQQLGHPACDFARLVMQAALAGTGIWLSDGPTTLLPIEPHRAGAGRDLSAAERDENKQAIHRAWRRHVEDIRRALAAGFYQGWDLHPAQLATRYAAVYAFFLEGLTPASERLRHFVEQAARPTTVGSLFDDAATGQGLLNYFLRALGCGAIDEQEAVTLSGLTVDELRTRSFVQILDKRRAGAD